MLKMAVMNTVQHLAGLCFYTISSEVDVVFESITVWKTIIIGHMEHRDTGGGTQGDIEWDMGTQAVGHGESDMRIGLIFKTYC